LGQIKLKKGIRLNQIGPLFLNIEYKYIQTDIYRNHFLHSRDQRKIYPPKLTKNRFLLVITILPLHYRVGRNKKKNSPRTERGPRKTVHQLQTRRGLSESAPASLSPRTNMRHSTWSRVLQKHLFLTSASARSHPKTYINGPLAPVLNTARKTVRPNPRSNAKRGTTRIRLALCLMGQSRRAPNQPSFPARENFLWDRFFLIHIPE
jgi:hypothetical protein